MGTHLACVQVYLGDKRKADARALVIETLRRRVLEGALTETTQEADQDPDREVFVGPPGDAPWLTIFDTQGDLRELAQTVSAAIDGTTIFISLIDSDVVHLRRYSGGQVVDDYCNAPHLYDSYGLDADWLSDWDEASEEELKALTRGDLASWRDLLVEGVDLDELRDTWDSEPVFADDILWATANALAMNKEEIGSGSWFGAEKSTRLTFRLMGPRAYEVKAGGPPRLSLASYVAPSEIYVGEQLDLFICVQNNGGTATGLDIVAWGTAIDREIVQLRKAEVRKWPNLEGTEEMDFAPLRGRTGEQEMAVHVASHNSFELPQGISGGSQVMSQRGVDWRKAYEAIRETQFHVRVLGSVETTGTGELFIAFVPHANREDGQALWQACLKALPMPRQPLRCRDAHQPIHPGSLRRLETPSHLFALISLGTGREQSAEVAADAIETWAAKTAQLDTDRLITDLRTQLDLMPKKDHLLAGDIPASCRWKELRKALRNCVSFSIRHGGACVMFDVNPLFFQASDEEPVAHLKFCYSATALGEVELETTNEWLVGMTSSLMTSAAGLQAVVGRWEWQESMDLSMTPYELACGIAGQCTTARSWCERFLRGVTGQLWLGPDLLARLGEADRLTSIATIGACGNGVRVVLNDDATLDELETALEPLLASQTDWREGMARLHARK
jgi:hypothetical protein